MIHMKKVNIKPLNENKTTMSKMKNILGKISDWTEVSEKHDDLENSNKIIQNEAGRIRNGKYVG